MSRILRRASGRYLVRHPWQMILAVVGVAIGVAVVIAINLANHSARQAFTLAGETIGGKATHQLVPGPAGLPEQVYVDLRVKHGIRPSAPVVEGYARVPGHPGWTFQIVGVDAWAERPFRPWFGESGMGGDPGPFFTQPGEVLITRATAASLGLERGSTLPLEIGGRPGTVTIAGLIEPATERAKVGLEAVMVADLATAQELLGMVGKLSRIDLILDDAGGQRVAELLPPGARLEPVGSRGEALTAMTRAFELNLTALSLLALLVGLFLIYNTMTFSVVQRRGLIGGLRALGVTRREILRLVIGEAAVIGALGTGLGLALGYALAGLLLRQVTRTINDLYFVLSVTELRLAPGPLAAGVLLGLGATVLAALPAALEAASSPPRVSMRRSSVERPGRWRITAAAGLVALVVGAGILLIPSRSVLLGFLGLFVALLGFGALTPPTTIVAMRVLQPLAERVFGHLGRLAVRGVTASLSRTAVAVAALAMAVSVTVGVGMMITSFRTSVDQWLKQALQADIFVSPPHLTATRSDAAVDPAVVAALEARPEVAGLATIRDVDVPSRRGTVNLLAMNPGPRSEASYQLQVGDPTTVWPRFERDEACLISEPFAYRFGLGVGDTVTLAADRAWVTLPILGVYFELGSTTGTVLVHRDLYRRLWDDEVISGVGLYLKPGIDPDALTRRLRNELPANQELLIRTSATLRAESLDVFDQTFVITGVFRLMAGVVAFIGVLSALMAIQLERARELAVLRAVGVTPRQVWGLVSAQTALLGLVAGALAMPLGYVMAVVLIKIINRRSFGWTLPVINDPALLLSALGLALAAALLAGIYPAWRMARTSPALALREE